METTGLRTAPEGSRERRGEEESRKSAKASGQTPTGQDAMHEYVLRRWTNMYYVYKVAWTTIQQYDELLIQ